MHNIIFKHNTKRITDNQFYNARFSLNHNMYYPQLIIRFLIFQFFASPTFDANI